jgi:hypothetical protein
VPDDPATSAAPSAAGDPSVRASRIERAERYFTDDLRGQRSWYSERASQNKQRAQRLGFAIIGGGALLTFLQIFTPAWWVPYASGAIGVALALIEGAQRIWKFDATWEAYRVASERMKRELRLYVNGVGDYAAGTGEDATYAAFVVAVEQIIAEEQQIYWQLRAKTPEAEPQQP